MIRALLVLAAIAVTGCAVTGGGRADFAEAPYELPENAIVLRVKVTDVEFTDFSPGGCEPDAHCIAFYFWYRYAARVQDVVVGEWSHGTVGFTHLQHGEYLPALVRDCYVVLVPASDDVRETIGVPLIADRIVFRDERSTIRQLRLAAKARRAG